MQNVEKVKKAAIIVALGFFLSMAYSPEFQAAEQSIVEALVPILASVFTFALFALVSYRFSMDVRILLVGLLVFLVIRYVLIANLHQLSDVANLFSGVVKAFGFLTVGTLLTFLPKNQIGNSVLLGTLLSCLIVPFFYYFTDLAIEQVQFFGYVFLSISMLLIVGLEDKEDLRFLPAREAFRNRNTKKGENSKSLEAYWLLVVIIPGAFLFFCIGMFETFSIATHGFESGSSTLAAYISFGLVAVIYLVFKVKKVRSLTNFTLTIIGIIFLGSLFVILILDDYSSLIFSILSAVIVVMHIPIWVFLTEYSKRNSISPVFLYGIVISVLFVAIGAGRVCALTLFGDVVNVYVVSKVAAAVLFITSLAALVFFVVVTNRNDATADESIIPPQQIGHVNENFHEYCKRSGVTEREFEIISLYTSGRNTPFISKELFIANSTVKTHIRRAYKKLGVHNRQELLDLMETLAVTPIATK